MRTDDRRDRLIDDNRDTIRLLYLRLSNLEIRLDEFILKNHTSVEK